MGFRSLRLLALGGAMLAFSSTALHAQTVITGKVTSGGRPLSGASVLIQDTQMGAVTTVAGTYRFTIDAAQAKGRKATLVARAIGFKPQRRPTILSPGAQTADFELERDVLQLDQVVVTGVAAATSQKKLAFSVGVVGSEALKEAPGVTPLAGLSGKLAGVEVVQGVGGPGAPPAIRLRSATSLSGSQEPLIIIDGTISRTSLADISSEDIDRIEVIKGAAASSLYGSDAANGVIQIFTKRGANLGEGQLAITLRNEVGASTVARTLPRSLSHAFQLNPDGSYARLCPDATTGPECPRVSKPDDIADNPYPVVYNQQGQVLKSGLMLSNYLSIGQRSGNTNYNVSFQNTQQDGVVTLAKGFARRNLRASLDQHLNEQLDFSVGMFIARSNDGTPALGNGSPFFGITFLEPDANIYAKNPDGSPYAARIPDLVYNASNPLYRLANESRETTRNRATGTSLLRYRPFSWLTGEANFNYDEHSSAFADVYKFGFISNRGVATPGSLLRQDEAGLSYNTGATLTAVKNLGWMINTTKAAFVYESQAQSLLTVSSGSFAVPGVPEFGAVNGVTIPTSYDQAIKNRNEFLISTFDIKDKLIFDGLVRQDESSLFGSAARRSTYYRASGAYRLNEDLKLPGIDELKLRASIGTAGLRPPFEAQYETFTLNGGAPQKQTLGNTNLRPAHSTEQEYGLNVDWAKRFTFEYSYSKKKTSDQILLVPLSASAGYANQWQNAGTLEGSTHEISFGAVVASSKDFLWRMNIVGDRTRQRITALSVAPYMTGPDGSDATTTIFRIAPGEVFGTIYGDKWVHSIDALYDDPTKKAQSGPGQFWSRDSVIVNQDGYVVRKSRVGTKTESPLKYVDANGHTLSKIGDVNPDFTLSTSNSMSWKSLSMSSTLSWVKGGNIYNMTRQYPFFENRDAVYDQRGKAQADKKTQSYYNVFYDAIGPNEFFVENGGYVRLRELAVGYQLPSRLVANAHLAGFTTAKISVVGRNLLTWTKYSGYDPEVSGPGGGDPFTYRIDYFTYPNFRTFTLGVELGR